MTAVDVPIIEAIPRGSTRLVLVVVSNRVYGEALALAVQRLPGFVAACPQDLGGGEWPSLGAPRPDVAVVDAEADREDVLALVAGVREQWGSVPIVLILSRGGVSGAKLVRDAGAAAWVSAGGELDDLEEALHAASSRTDRSTGGLRPLSAISDVRRDLTPAGCCLTPRELEIVRLLGAGSSVGEIASQLDVSPNTVRKHTQNACYKLGARSRLELVAIARRQRLLLAGSHSR